MVEEMNYTYVVSCIDDGDGGAEIDRFTNKTDAIKCWIENVDKYPDKTFDVAIEDEDGEWIDIISPFSEEEIDTYKPFLWRQRNMNEEVRQMCIIIARNKCDITQLTEEFPRHRWDLVYAACCEVEKGDERYYSDGMSKMIDKMFSMVVTYDVEEMRKDGKWYAIYSSINIQKAAARFAELIYDYYHNYTDIRLVRREKLDEIHKYDEVLKVFSASSENTDVEPKRNGSYHIQEVRNGMIYNAIEEEYSSYSEGLSDFLGYIRDGSSRFSDYISPNPKESISLSFYWRNKDGIKEETYGTYTIEASW